MHSLLDEGLSHQQAGRLPEAHACYTQVLQAEPQHPEALHLMGVLARQMGLNDASIQLLRHAIRGNPQAACYHRHLADAYAGQGNTEAAIASYRQAAALDPDDAESLFNLANLLAAKGELPEAAERYECVLQLQPRLAAVYDRLGEIRYRQGNLTAAAEAYRGAVALQPSCAEFHHHLASVLHRQGALAEAAASYRAVLALQPGSAAAHYSLGVALQRMEDWNGAAESYVRALELAPDMAETYTNLGAVCLEMGDLNSASAMLRRALAQNPNLAGAAINLGAVLSKQGDTAGALDCYRHAVACAPEYAPAHCNLGFALEREGDLAEAQNCYRRALECQPDFATARFFLGTTHLLQANFREGWSEYEARWDTPEFARSRRSFSQPVWRGEPLAGERILLHAEQGLGDTMQFVRYVPLVAARGGRVVLEVQPRVHRLLANLPGAEKVIARGEALPEFRWHCPLLSLPLAFATDLTTIPAGVPYLHPDETEARSWSRRLEEDGNGLRVGLAWAGNPAHVRERQRSLPLEQLAPLTQVEGATFYSLQKGRAASRIQTLPEIRLVDLNSRQRDFADTAAIVANLDLVITIDTSIAHLAGGMGKPVWILLPYMADWRWLREREDSPWYPTARLFRQTVPGDWAAVVERVRKELERVRQKSEVRSQEESE